MARALVWCRVERQVSSSVVRDVSPVRTEVRRSVRLSGCVSFGPACRPVQPAMAAVAGVRWFFNAASKTARQLRTCEWRRSSARRSRSVMPPHTPNSIRLSSASARHSNLTGHDRHTRLAMFCSAPCTNNASGSPSRHAASAAHSAFSPITQDPPLGPPAEPCRARPVWAGAAPVRRLRSQRPQPQQFVPSSSLSSMRTRGTTRPAMILRSRPITQRRSGEFFLRSITAHP